MQSPPIDEPTHLKKREDKKKMREKKAFGFSVSEKYLKVMREASKKRFEGNLSMLINIAVREWLERNGFFK